MDELDLETRDGLPEHLRVLARLYPRETWQGHPNFGGLTAFWLERHMMFRQLIDRLVEGSETHLDSGDPRFGPEMSRYTGFFLNQLHGHHMIEDEHYFPRFIPLDKRLERGFEILDRDHHALDGHIHALAEQSNAVLKLLQAGEDEKKAVDILAATQRDFRRFLTRHLEDEEEIIVPVILEYGAELE
ncbi:MAG: hemerythrin domain-containing protein [Pseudooceanicola sp.]